MDDPRRDGGPARLKSFRPRLWWLGGRISGEEISPIVTVFPAGRRDHLLLATLFVLVAGTYAYFFQGGGWNANSRFALTRAIVERGRIDVTPYRLTTGDLALREGRYYCDKAPGVSWMAVPAYALVHAISGEGRRPSRSVLEWGLYASILTVIALPSAVIVVLLCRRAILLGVPAGGAVLIALAYGLGTLALPYSTLLYGHQLAAVLLFLAFDLLLGSSQAGAPPSSARLAAVGLLLGWSVAVEYPMALACLVLGAWALRLARPRRRVLWLVAGVLPSALALAAYHWRAFGGPFTVAYSFSTLPERHLGHFMGIAAIHPAIVTSLLVGSYRGLLTSAPWLIAAVPGALLLLLRLPGSREWVAVCATLFGAFLALNASLVDWHGGFAFGPRYLVPVLPLLALLATGLLLPLPRVAARMARWAMGLLVLGSIGMMLVATAVRPETPLEIARPFEDSLIPHFSRCELALNPIPVNRALPSPQGQPAAWQLGQRCGLEGCESLVPLVVWLILGASLLGWQLAARRRG
jgi:hypothetical protein